MIFVDTNFFLRFLLKDQNAQHQQAKSLFHDAARGKIRLFTSLIVFFEIYWVLSSFYEKQKKELIEKLESVLAMSFVQFQERSFLEAAVTVFKETPLDLEDAFNLVYASSLRASRFETFDRKLQKIFLCPS